MKNPTGATTVFAQLAANLGQNAAQIERDPQFAKWLAEEYKPVAGGWQY